MTKQDARALRRPLKRQLFRRNRFNFFMTVVSSLMVAVSALVMSWLLKEVLDCISGVSPYTLGDMLLIMGGGGALLMVGAALEYNFLPRFRARAVRQYREYVFEALTKKGIQAFAGENTSFYISALSNDINAIEAGYLDKLQMAAQMILVFLGALAMMLFYSPLLTLIAIVIMALPVAVSLLFGNRLAEAEKALSDKKTAYTDIIKDALLGFAVVKSFKAERAVARLHESSNRAVAEGTVRKSRIAVLIEYLSTFAGALAQFGVFFAAAMLALSGQNITAGTAIVFVQLMNYLLNPAQNLPPFLAGRKAAFALMDKLDAALRENVAESGERIDPKLTEGIALENVRFAYEADKPVLKGLDMDFRAGGCYALVGGSGSGKSTILNLLMGAYKSYEGSVRYDGREVRDINPESLYDLVSIIQQGVFVFNSTIQNNITMFSDFPPEQVAEAARLSGLEQLMAERGAAYLCGENGSGLSGGERQRISIARALLRRTPLLLVDEATASLDAETSFGVLSAILGLEGFTRILVTHDLDEAILRRCDGIYTLRAGRVAEAGTFDELMAQKGYFYSLFTVSQGE